MSRQKTVNDTRNEAFIFEHCGRQVPPEVIGTRHRNHCHHCPWSKHVDMRTGDRREWSIIHRCRLWGIIRTNRIAGDDSRTLLFWIAARPLTKLPFPADAVLYEWEIDILNKEGRWKESARGSSMPEHMERSR